MFGEIGLIQEVLLYFTQLKACSIPTLGVTENWAFVAIPQATSTRLANAAFSHSLVILVSYKLHHLQQLKN